MATAKSTSKKVKPAARDAGLPMFFKKPSVLDPKRHATASVIADDKYGFARDVNSIALNTLEFIEASKFYPIVFGADDKATPVAILGLDQTNFFVANDGSWAKATYIPAYARQYPFIFYEEPQDKRYYLCIDEAAPHYSAKKVKDGSPLFTAKGEPSVLSNNALQFCTAYYQHHAITQNFCADLVKYKLLKPYHSEAKLLTGKEFKLSGFRMIDETVLNALPDAAILDLRQKGWLPFIYFALASASNWKRLLDLAS